MDPKKLWQDQPTEPSKVTMVLIRQKARELHSKTRRELFNTALGHVFIVVLCGAGIVFGRFPAQRMAFAIGLAWALAGAWMSQRGMWVPPMPGDAGFQTGLQFYRQEIQRRRSLFRRWLMWTLGPVILGLSALVAGPFAATLAADPRMLRNAIPFTVLLAVWAIGIALMRKRGERDIQREIDELSEIEKESRS